MSTIKKQTSGLLAGFSAIDIDQSLFAQFTGYCEGRFGYQMGGKCSNIGHFPPTWELNGHAVNGCDCSGFVRALLDYATNGGTSAMPDGSWMEDGWFGKQGFKKTEYSNCGNDDNFVRVAIHRPGGRGGDAVGHIWLICHQHTIESCGGHGPFEQHWQNYDGIVDDCYVLGSLV